MKTNKLLSAILCIAMIFSTMSFAVFADELSVAKVGDVEYTTIEDAVAAWKNGTTLTLLADVKLSSAITLSSLEHHILDLSAYTMTAADSDAIVISADGLTNANYVLDIKADETNPGGIVAAGKGAACVKHVSSNKDRAIIRIYGGKFTAPYCLYHEDSSGTNAPQFWIYGGEFTAEGQSAGFLKPISAIYANRALIQIYGGKFNSGIHASVDSSAYMKIEGGTFASLKNTYMSALNNEKITIGTDKGKYDVNVYMDDDGNYVVTKEDVSSGYEATVPKQPSSNDYFAYSKVAEEGKMNYTDVNIAIEDAEAGDTITLLGDAVLTESGAAAAAAAGVVFATGEHELTYPESYTVDSDGKIAELPVVAKIGEVGYYAFDKALAAAQDGDTIVLADGTYTMPNSVVNKKITINGTSKAGTVVEMLSAVNATGSTIAFENLTAKFDNDNYEGLQHSANIAYKNCIHIGTEFLYAPQVSYTDCTFEMYNDVTEYAVWTYGSDDVEFINCTFNTNGKAINVYTEAAHTAEIELNDCTFTSNGKYTGKAAVEVGQSAYGNKADYTIKIDGCTADDNFTANNSTSNLWGNKNSMDTAGMQVVVDSKVVYGTDVAKIGEAEYLTIQDAVDAANDGDTIVLCGDAAETDGIEIADGKNVIIDLAGYKVTGFFYVNGAAKIENGTIDASSLMKSAVEINSSETLDEVKGTFAPELTLENVNAKSNRHVLRIDGGEADINGGTYEVVSTVGTTQYAVNASTGAKVNISGGTFTSVDDDPTNGDYVIGSRGAGTTVTINGGTFTKSTGGALYEKDGEIIVNAGTYDQDPAAYLNPDEEGLKVGKAAYAKLWTVINDSRKIVPEADKTEVEADEIVTIAVKVYGENLREGYWKLTYDTDLFVCAADTDNNGEIIGTKTLTDNTTDVFADGETLATYEFKALAQNADATGTFETVGVRTYTASESKDGYTFEADGGKAEVAVKLTAYEAILKVDGEKVTGTGVEVPYTAAEHRFAVTAVPDIAAGEEIKITITDENGNEVDEMIEKGTYTIAYTIPAQLGFAEYNGTFELTIGSPEYVVEVNTGKGYFADYVLGKKLVLAYTNTPNVAFEYDGNYMIDVSAKGYLYNNVTSYTYVYAIVVDALSAGSTVDDYITAGGMKDVKLTDPVASLVKLDMDINSNGELHLSDIISIYDTYNVDEDDLFNEASYSSKLVYARCMNIILKSDVDGNKTVTGDDTEEVVTAVYNVING